MTTTALKACPCSIPRPRITPGKERQCVVCQFQIPDEWGSQNITGIFDRLALSFPAGAPDGFRNLRDLCLAREQDGRIHFGYRFHGVDLMREVKEELADAMNYLGFHIIVCRRRGDEERADKTLNAMHRVYEAFEAIATLGLE